MSAERRNAAVAALAAAVSHLPSLAGPFQFDDYNAVVHNPAVGGVRPLLKASYALNWALFSSPAGFHAFNIAIHALNASLVYGIGRLLCALWLDSSRAASVALVAALLFALHPAQTEAVTYICGRSSSLMATFYLGAALLYLRGASVLCAVSFALALAVKESAVTLPAALLLFEASASGRKDWKEIIRRQAPSWLILGAGLLIMLASSRYRDLLGYGFTQRTFVDNLLTQVNGIFYLLARLTTLRGYNIDPGLPELHSWTPVLVGQTAALVALLSLGLWSLRRRPVIGFGILWFFLQLAPTNSFVPRLDPANDRQLYLACCGPLLALAVGVARERVVVGILLTLFAAASVARQREYRSEITLWEASVHEAPDNARAHNNLGHAYQDAGRIDEAREEYRTALRLNPSYIKAGVNLRLLDWDASP